MGSLANPMYRGVGYDYTRYGEDVASFRRDYLAVWEARRECRDDAVPCISPQLGGSTEAAFWAGELEWGAEVASLRPQYPLETAPRLESIRFDPTNRYYQRVLREIGFLSETAGQGYGVNFEANLSITTTISQLIGPERFLLGLYDEPEGIRALAEAIAGQILALLSHVCRAVPHPAGGTCHRWINYWNPGWGYWFSEDDAILLSPSFYERFFLDLDARLCAACDCAAVHWHSGALPLVGLLDRLPGLRMLQVSFDPNGPDLEQVIAACAGFARDGRKVCLQMGPDLDRIRDVLRRIDPGACMLYLSSAPSISAANDLADSVAGLCRRKPWT